MDDPGSQHANSRPGGSAGAARGLNSYPSGNQRGRRTRKWLVLAGMSLLMILSATFLVAGVSVLAGNPLQVSQPLYTSLIVLLAVLGLYPLGRQLSLGTEPKQGEEDVPAARRRSLDVSAAGSAEEIASILRAQIAAAMPLERLHIFVYDRASDSYLDVPGINGGSGSDLRFPGKSRLTELLFARENYLEMEGEAVASLPQAEKIRLELLDARILIPLKGSERLLGWIAPVWRPERAGVCLKNLPRLDGGIRQAAAAFERIQMVAIMQTRLREMDALIRVAQGVNVTLGLDDIYELICAQTSQVIPSEQFRILMFEPPSNEPVLVFSVRGGERLSIEEQTCLSGAQLPEYDSVCAGTVYYSEDYRRELRLRGGEDQQRAPSEWLAVPLRAGAETIGLIGVGRDEPAGGFTAAQQQTLQAIADLAAGAIIKARLLAESEKRTHQLRTLYDMTRQLSTTLDQELLLKDILKNAVDILDCEAGSLLMADEQSKELVFRVTLGPVAGELLHKRMPWDSGVAGNAFIGRKAIVVNDVRSSDLWVKQNDQVSGFSSRSLLAVPLQVKNRALGVIEVINRKDGSDFTLDDQELLAAFASQAAVAVENATLYTMTDQALAVRVEELSVMQRIDRELNTSLDVNRAMKITLEWAMRRSGATAGLVGMVEPAGIRLMASQGYDGELAGYQDHLLPATKAHLDQLLAKGKPVQVRPVQSGSTLLDGAQSQIVIPIRREKEVTGVILLESSKPEVGSQEVVDFLTRLGDHASIAIANAQLYNAVQAANLAKSEFVSFVAHELKNPMTSIKGYTELLAARAVGPVNENQANFLQVIRANIDRMNTLVSDLNDLSKIEVGRMRLEFSAIGLAEVVSEVERSTRRQIEEKGQRFILQIPENLPYVWVDRDRLMQVLVNLVSNAYKYTDHGGEIILGAQVDTEGREGSSQRQMVRVWVRDNGIGISSEDQVRIFQKFFRSEDPKTREVSGAGLGLNITRSLVEMQGGKIWFESEYRKGTTFYFTVPVAR